MKLKKGDTVLVISGKDRGKVAKILRSFPKEKKILVEGVHVKNKHVKPRKQGEQGQVIRTPSPLAASNVKFICPKCGKAARIGYRTMEGKKFRICKKCKSEI